MHAQLHRSRATSHETSEAGARSRAPVRRPNAAEVIQRKCAACSAEDDEIHRRADQGADAGPFMGVPRTGGAPLDAGARSYFEPRFGRDFSDVRIHTGAGADTSARSVGAIAYTSGRDMVFRQGAFAPDTDAGKKLLAHELTHVVQQGSGASPGAGTRVSEPHDPAEREADQVADRIMRSPEQAGAISPVSASTIQRIPDTAPAAPAPTGQDPSTQGGDPTKTEEEPGGVTGPCAGTIGIHYPDSMSGIDITKKCKTVTVTATGYWGGGTGCVSGSYRIAIGGQVKTFPADRLKKDELCPGAGPQTSTQIYRDLPAGHHAIQIRHAHGTGLRVDGKAVRS